MTTLRHRALEAAPLVAFVTFLSVTACSEGGPGIPLTDDQYPAKGQSIALNPPVAEILEAGQKIQLTADVRDALGKQVANPSVKWETLDPSVATVNFAGTVTGMSEGVAEIRGTYGGVSSTAVIAVSRPKLRDGSGETVTLYPDADTVTTIRGSTKMLAVGRNRGGNLVSGNKLKWSTEDASIATVDGDGVVTGEQTGTTKVIVENGSAADTSQVWVAPSDVAVAVVVTPAADTIPVVGGTIQLSATVLNGSNLAIDGADVGWESLDPAVATVSAGTVLGVKKGIARIVAVHNTFRDTATVWVEPVLAATSLYVEPKTDTIPNVGDTVKLTATILDGSGQPLAQSVTWGTMDAAVATVTSDGTVKGVSSGLARITARYSTLVDTAKIWVAPAPPKPLYTVVLDPASVSVASGDSMTVKATVLDSKGIELTEARSAWQSLDGSIASVSTPGPATSVRVRGLADGSTKVIASYGGVADTAVVTVGGSGGGTGSGSNVARSVIRPNPAAISEPGQTVRVTWDAWDEDGNELLGLKPTWTSLDPTIVSAPSVGTAVADLLGESSGTTKVVATLSGVSDTVTVTVGGPGGGTAGPTVIVSPSYTTLEIGSTKALTAVAKDSAGNAVTSAQLSWQSLDASMASVSSAGVVTGLGVGSARIRVSWSSVSDTAIVYVNQPLPTGGTSLTPGNLVPVVGPLVARTSANNTIINGYDGRYTTAEQSTYDTWVANGQQGADASSHYGALRSRYQWSLRSGLPVGPSAPAGTPYQHGVAMTRAFLTKYAQPNQYRIAPHNNTMLADIELLYRLENDQVALAHIQGSATFYARDYGEHYFDLTGSNSDPRMSAILIQTMNVAQRLGLPYTGRSSWGSSWISAADYMVDRMAQQIPASGKVTSLAHKNTGQGDEAYFMNAMLATELLRWHGFVQPQPTWFSLARRIVDHLIDEYDRIGAVCLPYKSSQTGCAPDLAAYYVWPSLVLWQETGDAKYRDFAMLNIDAARKAYIVLAKIFNQTYSTGAQSAEALLIGVSWH